MGHIASIPYFPLDHLQQPHYFDAYLPAINWLLSGFNAIYEMAAFGGERFVARQRGNEYITGTVR
jgi:hypothetical protein